MKYILMMIKLAELDAWASAAGGREGAVAPLDFHTWYKYNR